MKKLFFALFLILISNVNAQIDEDFNNGIDFKGGGVEPFWSLKIDEEKGMYFELAGNELKFETDAPIVKPTDKMSGRIYTAESEKFNLRVTILKETCSDGMSDLQYPYSLKVSITRKGYKEIREFTGCGNYTYNPLLNDIWALVNFKGKDIKGYKGLNTKPYMEIHISESKIMGNASCNEFFGNAEVIGDKISFGDKMTQTKMNCSEMNLEIDFLWALSGKIYKYKIEKMKLYLTENDSVIMEFNKMD